MNEFSPRFQDESGNLLCPSGCLSTDSCTQIALIAALSKTDASLREASKIENLRTSKVVLGSTDHLEIRNTTNETIRRELSQSCLLAHESGL